MLYKLKRLVLRLFGQSSFISRRAKFIRSTHGNDVQVAQYAHVVNSKLNSFTSVGRNATIINAELGKFCSISWNVTIGATSHHTSYPSTHAFPYVESFGFSKRNELIVVSTNLGNDVWIGANAIVLPGVRIGNGAVIGAGAVVTKDVPPFAICVGVPARVVKFRFGPELIEQIENLKWWDWRKEKLLANIQFFKKPLTEDEIKKLIDV